jgi:malate dehydrogenase
LVTGAAGQIAYSLIYMVSSGEVFGRDQPIILHLLDIPPMQKVLDGVCMEINDCALPLVRQVVATTDVNVAFKDISAAFMVGAMPRKQGMERKDLLSANVKIFKEQGQALDKNASKDVKVLVVGNPANTNALICSKYAPSIPKANFTAMTRLDQNRGQSQIAVKVGVPISDVSKVIVWGNHSVTQYPDVAHAEVVVGGAVKKVKDVVDDAWVKDTFIGTVQKRGAAVIAARGLSSAMSAAKAACDHMKDWWQGTGDRWVSMGVFSDRSYKTPEGVMYSFPCTCKDKKWSIVQGLEINDFARAKMDATGKELVEERDEATAACEA